MLRWLVSLVFPIVFLSTRTSVLSVFFSLDLRLVFHQLEADNAGRPIDC